MPTLGEIEEVARRDAEKIPRDALFQEPEENPECMVDWRVIEVTGYEMDRGSLLLEIDGDGGVFVSGEDLAPLFVLHDVENVDELIGCEVCVCGTLENLRVRFRP